MAMMQLIRKHIEKLYTGQCDIWEYKEKEENNITFFDEKLVASAVPCRLSFSKVQSGTQGAVHGLTVQQPMLILSPDIVIKPGSKLIVNQSGLTTEYQNSGQPAVYETHQEIGLELFRGWT